MKTPISTVLVRALQALSEGGLMDLEPSERDTALGQVFVL